MDKQERGQCKKIDNYLYKYSDVLGQGNFSTVYKAKNQITNQTVAIKVIELNSLKSPKLQELLFSQIDVLKKLNHINILRCYEVFTSNRNCYIITQLCNGGDLEEILKKKDKLTETQALPYIRDIFNGLNYLSQNSVIHRDLKVANIFLHEGVAKIADFGFAKITKENFKDINIGSPLYMSPEGLLYNLYGEKTDVWAFGILLFQLLHGKTPHSFCRSESELRRQIMTQITQKNINKKLSKELVDVIIECLQVDENKRPKVSDLKKMPFFQNLKRNSSFVSLGPRKLVNPTIQISKGSQTHCSLQKARPTSFSSHHNHEVRAVSINKNPHTIQSTKLVRPNFVNFEESKQKINFKNQNKYPILHKQNLERTPLTPSNDVANKWQRKSPLNFFQGVLNFRQCINLLHYCRLIYKYLISIKQISYPLSECERNLSFWIFRIINAIHQKLDSKEINFDDSTGAKEKKMREVTNEYQKKYSLDIQKPILVETNFKILEMTLRNKVVQIQNVFNKNKTTGLLHILHFLIILVQSTKILGRCWEKGSYEEWKTYMKIEQFLSRDKNALDYGTYINTKKIVW